MSTLIYEKSYILTNNGYFIIDELINKEDIFIWNGHEWKNIIIKINNNFNHDGLYKIILSDGCELLCSESHYLNIVKQNKEINNIKSIKVNDLLDNYTFPVIDGLETNNILYPYTHGYYCGYFNKLDQKNNELFFESNLIYINLINDKQKIKSEIEITGKYSINKEKTILTGLLKLDIDKTIKAPINGDIENKLTWLSGLIDNNGFITKVQDAKYLNISVLSKKFATEIKFLFNTIGINPYISIKSDNRKYKLKSGEIHEVIKYYWIISLNADDTNKMFFKSEFDLKIFYLEYDKSFYSIDQNIDRYLSIKKISKLEIQKKSFIIENTNSLIINGVLIYNSN